MEHCRKTEVRGVRKGLVKTQQTGFAIDVSSQSIGQDTEHALPIIDSLRTHPLVTTIAVALTFCLLWLLVICILYELTRTALLAR